MNDYRRKSDQLLRDQHALGHQMDTLGFTARTKNSLLRGGYSGLSEVRDAADDELMCVRQLGVTGIHEIRERLGAWVRPQRLTARCPACNHMLVLSLPEG